MTHCLRTATEDPTLERLRGRRRNTVLNTAPHIDELPPNSLIRAGKICLTQAKSNSKSLERRVLRGGAETMSHTDTV